MFNSEMRKQPRQGVSRKSLQTLNEQERHVSILVARELQKKESFSSGSKRPPTLLMPGMGKGKGAAQKKAQKGSKGRTWRRGGYRETYDYTSDEEDDEDDKIGGLLRTIDWRKLEERLDLVEKAIKEVEAFKITANKNFSNFWDVFTAVNEELDDLRGKVSETRPGCQRRQTWEGGHPLETATIEEIIGELESPKLAESGKEIEGRETDVILKRKLKKEYDDFLVRLFGGSRRQTEEYDDFLDNQFGRSIREMEDDAPGSHGSSQETLSQTGGYRTPLEELLSSPDSDSYLELPL
ncbi:hypothetical protein P7C70_g9659, partial [Phenoliferia sp. Uapishka_3]